MLAFNHRLMADVYGVHALCSLNCAACSPAAEPLCARHLQRAPVMRARLVPAGAEAAWQAIDRPSGARHSAPKRAALRPELAAERATALNSHEKSPRNLHGHGNALNAESDAGETSRVQLLPAPD
ncbi:MAG TPA: hypothetical protein VM074_02580 [Solimonas sp.]|nr:hypothetical protein [Solimonas sp.]